MKLLYVADGRSPIALNWIRYFVEAGHEVHLVSTYPCAPELPLASSMVVPVGGSEWAGSQPSAGGGRRVSFLRRLIPVGWRTGLRRFVAPLTLGRAARRLRAMVDDLHPEIVHAMRIPFEGMLAAQAMLMRGRVPPPPLIVSVWGNDFTLHATATPTMGFLTRLTLQNVQALHTDCHRDQRLAQAWGFDIRKPVVVLPGNGGIDLRLFHAGGDGERQPVVVNPRGMRAYVRNDTFFQAIRHVLVQRPEVRWICPAMAGESESLRWVNDLGIASSVELLPRQSPSQMAQLFRRAQVMVSLTEHDGTPNTLLEAMACGCYPVAGDIESLREWITPGVNGALVAPASPSQVAEAILEALASPHLRRSAASHNLQIIQQRAEYGACMAQAEAFYRSLR